MVVLAVCDDDIAFTKIISNYLNSIFISMPESVDYKIYKFTSSAQLLDYIETSPINILLLDIDMPGTSGFQIAELLQQKSPDTIIIFVSAYDNFVYDSFQFNPFCFLRKEHLKSELKNTMQRVINKFYENNKTLLFKTTDGSINIRLKDINYFESVKNYYHIYLKSGDIYKCRGALTSIESEIIDYDFYRIHKAFIVNLANIAKVDTNRQITLPNNKIFTVSLRKWQPFKEAYMNFSRKRVLLV